MHVRELQLIGFKSFQDKTTLRFSPRMNSVIGPNGCGKTNVLDALRWVLGEQSFNMLRVGKTEDLIFAGTARLPPTNYAEVRLVLANDIVPEYGAEIEIRRRYFRTGESEYYLNRQPCRAKDIQEVFLATGIGTKAYSIFDLRQMREIIAGNIRVMFEEAATLAKYREARADCLRKLELTDSDLTRLEDIIAERERVVRSLQRQAGRLRSWDKLKDEEKALRLVELKADFESARAELELVRRDADALEAAEAERLTEIRRIEEELHRHRARVRQEQTLRDEVAEELRRARAALAEIEGAELLGNQRAELLREDAARLDRERAELEQGIAGQDELVKRVLARLEQENAGLAELEAALERAREETRAAEKELYDRREHARTVEESLAGLLERQHEARRELARLEAFEQNLAETADRLDAELASLAERLAGQDEQRAGFEQSAEELASETGKAREKSDGLEASVESVEAERDRAHESLRAAREARQRLEKDVAVLSAGAADRLAALRPILGERLLGELADWLEVEPGWERACAAALQPLLDFVVTDADAEAGLERLLAEGPRSWCGLLAAGPGTVAAAEDDSLTRFVRCRAGAPSALAGLVAGFRVVEDGSSASAARGRFPGRPVCCRDGWALFPDGRLVVGGREGGRLQQSLKLKEKSAELETARRECARLEDDERRLESRRVELDREVEAARAALAELERRQAAFEARQEAGVQVRDGLARDRDRLEQERRSTAAARQRGAAELAGRRQELAELDSRVERAQAARDEAVERARAVEAEARQRLDAAAERLAALGEARQRVSRLESESRFARQGAEERRRRARELAEAAEAARARAEAVDAESHELGPKMESGRAAVAALEQRLDGLRVADLTRLEEDLDHNLTELRRAREQNQALLMEQRLKLHELEQHRRQLVEEARDNYQTDIESFVPEAQDDAAARLDRVRQRLGALGRVNPLAAEEYEQEKRDLDKLAQQRDDVVGARANLLATIDEIDHHARERFLATFGEVRHHFQAVFRELFLEGEADLVLADEARPLESEITIFARPRGKNPKRLEQLSDGEKALLAVSLLFAFYRVKPAPFCFLDEVDAPLDDANVARFADYLKRMSERTQVIIITHNRLTVERADSLFGVTAEQPGVSKLVSVSLADYRDSELAGSVS